MTSQHVFIDIEGPSGTLAKFGSGDDRLFIKTNVEGYPCLVSESSFPIHWI